MSVEGTYLSLWKGAIPFGRHGADPRPEGGMLGIQRQVEAWHDLDRDELKSLSRKRPIAWARQEFMWLCRQVKWPDGTPRYSLPLIGQFLGGMDHTTVLWGARRHQARLDAAEQEGAA